jgi:hypothetical protein
MAPKNQFAQQFMMHNQRETIQRFLGSFRGKPGLPVGGWWQVAERALRGTVL